jgi:iron complex outermembrane receptor protein
MTFSKFLRSSASIAVLGALCFGGSASAQNAATDGEDDVRTVDEIVVTAQKREQNLQDVPVVVTALSQQLMQDAGVKDIKDLQVLTPGLTVTSTSNETVTTARIRGVGTVGDNPGLESSVGIIIDGVYRPRNGVSFGDLGELERVEVLKGPQGTLFGKNTSAGVINILTAEPEFQFGGTGELTFGNYGQKGGSASVTGPLAGETVAGRLFVARRVRDGYLDVVTGPGPRTQDDDVNQDFWTVRGQILAAPSEALEVRVIADYTKRNESCCLGTQLYVGDAAGSRASFIEAVRPGSLDLTNTPFDRTAYANRDTDQNIDDKGVSVQVDYDLTDDMALTSVTAARDWRAETGQDSDFTAADLVWRPSNGDNFVQFKQFSQELRLAGDTGRINWLVGGFYAREDLDSRAILTYGEDYYDYFARRVLGGVPGLIGLTEGTVLQPGTGVDDLYAQDGKTFALFTNNNIDITDQLELTLGLRYTVDEKTLTSDYSTTGASCDPAEPFFNVLVAQVGAALAQKIVGGLCLNGQNNDFDDLGVTVQESKEKEWSGTAKLAYRITDDLMTYASYSRGYKAGGFNLDRSQAIGLQTVPNPLNPTGPQITVPNFTANPDTSFGGEFADSYEVGVKSQLFDNSLQLNATAFHQTFTDFQLNTFVGTAFIVETIPEVKSIGVDMDFLYFPPMVDGLTLQGGVTFTETQFSDFEAADLTNPSRFPSLARLPEARMAFAPKWSSSLAATYEHDLTEGLQMRSNVSVKYTSSYNTGSDLHPIKNQDGFALVNGRIGIGSPDERWTVELWGQNLTDEDYLQVAFNGPFQVDETNDAISVYDAFLGAPRTYGITLRSRF